MALESVGPGKELGNTLSYVDETVLGSSLVNSVDFHSYTLILTCSENIIGA